MPKPSPIDPSFSAAIAQTFSVQDRSDWLTVAKVSVIWWWNVSSAGTSGPSVVTPSLAAAPPATTPGCG
jgi:hypothetical protein